MPEAQRTPVAMTIAGSDSGGGAGIQADLKAFAAAGVHGTSAITALTAQSTVGVTAIHVVPPPMIIAQILTVAEDIQLDAVKLGMLGDGATIAAVVTALEELPAETPIVQDPVMIAESGARLLPEDALDALIDQLLPLATVITPNRHEATAIIERAAQRGKIADAALAQRALSGDDDALVEALRTLGPLWAMVTGGHRDEAVDLLVGPAGQRERIAGPRHPDGAAHGSGCTHASTLAAWLARGASVPEAARIARRVAAGAVEAGLRDVGAGAGPVDVLDLAARRAAS